MSVLPFIAMQVCLLGLAIFLAQRSCGSCSIGSKVLRFLGVLVSTIPLVGAIQLLALRERIPEYARACGWQAVAGLAYFGAASVLLRA